MWTYYRDYMLPAVRDFQPEGAPAGEPQHALDALVDLCRSWRPDLVLWDPRNPRPPVWLPGCPARPTPASCGART